MAQNAGHRVNQSCKTWLVGRRIGSFNFLRSLTVPPPPTPHPPPKRNRFHQRVKELGTELTVSISPIHSTFWYLSLYACA
jgi:hypothetical protein